MPVLSMTVHEEDCEMLAVKSSSVPLSQVSDAVARGASHSIASCTWIHFKPTSWMSRSFVLESPTTQRPAQVTRLSVPSPDIPKYSKELLLAVDISKKERRNQLRVKEWNTR